MMHLLLERSDIWDSWKELICMNTDKNIKLKIN